MILHRVSPNGLQFTLYKHFNKTEIRLGNKFLLIDMPIEQVSQKWYNWQMRGQFIQDAFRELKPEEREFLISGTTPEEWKKFIGDKEK